MALFFSIEGWFEKKSPRDERIWLSVALATCILFFLWMIGWHFFGKQNPSPTAYKTTPQEFYKLYLEFVKKWKVGEKAGIPVVKPPAEANVFLLARMWRWEPILILEKGKWYNFWISSFDIQHGFSLQPVNINLQILPGYIYVVRFRPTRSGEHSIICNEFCGIGHHLMVGQIYVLEEGEEIWEALEKIGAREVEVWKFSENVR